MIMTYGIIVVLLVVAELVYFKVADHFNIIDKPNERSSHSTIVLRGGGVIFTIGMLVWVGLQGAHGDWSVVMDYLPFLVGLLIIAGVSFIDDVHSLPDSVRLVAQFLSMGLAAWCMIQGSEVMALEWYWLVLIGIAALIVFVGATNIINFMDGINGITAGYALAVLFPLFLLNNKEGGEPFILNSLLGVAILSVLVFCIFNFRPKGKAKCFAGDVGSIGIAFIMLFAIGKLIVQTGELSYLVLLMIYGVDGVLTICHRIMLHENLGEAHRKHAFQLMANELKIGHVKVTLLYMALQLAVSLGFIYLCPDSVAAHWIYFVCAAVVLAIAYILFMRKYYYLHEQYLKSLEK